MTMLKLTLVAATCCLVRAHPVITEQTTLVGNVDRDLPDEWANICTSQRDVDLHTFNISCRLAESELLDFVHFRNWSEALDAGSLVSLDVTCEKEGQICFPWPYRAYHLDVLKIRDCMNMCYFAEYNTSSFEEIPDTLRVLETDGVIVAINVLEFVEIDPRSLSPDIECGPLNLEVYVKRASKEYFFAPGIPGSLTDSETTDSFIGDVHSSNDFTHVCRYEKMRIFDISDNLDSSVTEAYVTFINSRFPQLRVLNFSRTALSTFPSFLEAWRQRFEKLETLDLSYNNISRFDLRDMSLLSQEVGYIDLRFNNIKTVTAAELQSIKSLKKAVIDLRDNPFVCDCAMANFTTFLNKYNSPDNAGIHLNYEYLWMLQCMSPFGLDGRKIVEVSHEELCLTNVTAYVAHIAVLSIVVIILLFIVILLAKYRKEVRILAFTRFHIVLPCQPVEETSSKTYDAFVSYSHLDYQWVVKTLMPKLERGNPSDGVGANFKLCLHQRDFAVGAAIADNIVESVEASRHTVLVLSRNFLKSEWCIMEFRTAFHQSLIEKKKHLILVLLEDLPEEELDSDLRRCMQTWTYLHVSDKLFWDRLVYSLTDKNKIRGRRAVQQKTSSSPDNSVQTNNVLFTVPEETDKETKSLSQSNAGIFNLE